MSILNKSFALSILLHGLLFCMGNVLKSAQPKPPVEIDITNIGPVGVPGGRPSAAPTAPVRSQKSVMPTAPAKTSEPGTAKEESENPVSSSSGTSTGPVAPSEYGVGTGDGSASMLSQIPQLLNLSDVSAILRKFYPEEAREQGRQGTVLLNVHIDTEGRVTAVDVVKSGGAEFDEAAKKAAMLLRFTPAYLGGQRVNVKMRQAIQFKLEQ